MLDGLADAVGSALASEVRGLRALGGGDVALSYRVEMVDGSVVFAKTHAHSPPGFFVTEASGLQWLREANALPVPEVLAVDDGAAGSFPFLVLRWIDEAHGARPAASAEATFGEQLAALHLVGAPSFGREDRRPTGSRSLPNDPTATWAAFYRDRRLRPLARLAEEAGALGPVEIAALHDVAERLEDVPGADEPPARLHGDLWAGNRLVDRDGVSWLIDPAAHGGHREFDLAMMRLFGGFGPEAFEAYARVHPLLPGWEDRVALHQLAPLVVHAIKFGGSYGPATAAALRSCKELWR